MLLSSKSSEPGQNDKTTVILDDYEEDVFAALTQGLSAGTQANEWRRAVIQALGCKVVVVADGFPTKNARKQAIVKVPADWMYDCWRFIKYRPSPYVMGLADRICRGFGLPEEEEGRRRVGTEIVLIQREKTRTLYDSGTGLLLEATLKKAFPGLKVVCFEEKTDGSTENWPVRATTAREQCLVMSSARAVVACHGAALTNMICLPKDGHVVEISFRGTDSWTLHQQKYHKADFHNLAHLLDKGYTEVRCHSAQQPLHERPYVAYYKVFVDARKVVRALRGVLRPKNPKP